MQRNHSKKALLGLALGSLLLIGAGCGAKTTTTTSLDTGAGAGNTGANANANANADANADGRVMGQRQLEVELGALLGSGVSGKALLVEEGDKTEVTVDISGPGARGAHPAHIHLGACPTPGAVKWALSDVVDGRSTTYVEAKFGDIVAELPLAINVHLSGAELGKYLSCGDLLLSKVMTTGSASGAGEANIDAGGANVNAGMKVDVDVNAGMTK